MHWTSFLAMWMAKFRRQCVHFKGAYSFSYPQHVNKLWSHPCKVILSMHYNLNSHQQLRSLHFQHQHDFLHFLRYHPLLAARNKVLMIPR